MSCNTFNLFNNQVFLFNNQVELDIMYIYMINVSTKYVYDFDLFIFKKLKCIKYEVNSLKI